MKIKTLAASAMLALAATPAFAGGLLTNTNQNVAFNRMMSREASIGIDGVYSNPAGVAFLNDGFYLSLNWQAAFQSRTIENTYPLFGNNTQNTNPTHTFEGKAAAPVIPSFQMAYNKGRWSYQVNFALNGGGGKCTFDNGLGSFESAISNIAFGNVFQAIFGQQVSAIVPGLMAQGMTQEQAVAAATASLQNNPEAMAQMQTAALQNSKYSYDAYMRGRQYYFGLSLGAAYKVSDQLAVSAGLRGIYGTTNYYGYVRDITVAGQATGMEIALNCDQTGFGVTPILGVDFRPNNQWNFSARYEFKTRMRLENKAVNKMPEIDAVKAALSKFDDGKKVAEDIPALLTIGAGYSPVEALRINAGFHYFFDKQATAYGNKQDDLDRGTIEFNAGVEADVCKKLTVSAGWQTTNYGLTDKYMDDKSFVVNSNSIGAGVCYHLNDKIDINAAYFTTLYGHKKTDMPDANTGMNYTSDYTRTNNVLGIGVDIKF